MAILAVQALSRGPPAFYQPRFTVPQATLAEIQFAISPKGREFLKNSFEHLDILISPQDWETHLFVFTLSTHFDPESHTAVNLPQISLAYQQFCSQGHAEKGPVALYWPNALEPLIYLNPAEKGWIDLGQLMLSKGDIVSRRAAARILCLSRDVTNSKYASETLLVGLKDNSSVVRIEVIKSIIKCGYIPPTAKNALLLSLDNPRTYLVAASALYYLTGLEEYMQCLQEAAEGRKIEVAAVAAQMLDLWPSRQCSVKECSSPIMFRDFWIEWRKHSVQKNFAEAFRLWRTPTVDFKCHRCYRRSARIGHCCSETPVNRDS